MKKRQLMTIIFSLFILNSSLNDVHAEPIQQTFSMSPGWNAVFLEVEPQDTDPAVVFANIRDAATQIQDKSGDLLSVWMWNPNTGTVEYIVDPDQLVPGQPRYLAYLPTNPILTNLNAINGNTAYLAQMGGTADVILTVTGEPKVPIPKWKSNAFNFTGFHLTAGQEPSFESFFSTSPAHAGQEIYVLDNATGNWVLVAAEQMKQGEAFWVYCKGSSEFAGPLGIQLEQIDGLHYGKKLNEQDIYLFNNSAFPKTISITASALSNTLYYWVFKPADDLAGWVPIPTPLDVTIPAGESQRLQLGAKRAGLAADQTYLANLAVSDNAGMTQLIPVSVTGINYAGLWVGNATVSKVSEPANSADPATPWPTGSEFSFRLIFHADTAGNVYLLSQVIQMWQEGTWKPDPNDLGKLIVDQPGSFVLFTDDNLIAGYSGAAMRDGQPVGRRISSPAFPNLTLGQGSLAGTAATGGGFTPSPGNNLTINITLAQDDPTNPFRHMFHPDHREPEQSNQILRNITLTFADDDEDGRPITGVPGLDWGSSQVGGIFEEVVEGLHKELISAKGIFALHKVNDVETLTTN
jgi:hypothetical protein